MMIQVEVISIIIMFAIFVCLGFILNAISGYIRTKAYSVRDMEARELEIKQQAEQVVANTLSWPKRTLFNWVLFHARRGWHCLLFKMS